VVLAVLLGVRLAQARAGAVEVRRAAVDAVEARWAVVDVVVGRVAAAEPAAKRTTETSAGSGVARYYAQ